jgi:hypothetical protein
MTTAKTEPVKWAELCGMLCCTLVGAYFALLWAGHARPGWMLPAILILSFLGRQLRRPESGV